MDEVRHDLHALAAFVGWSDPRVEAPRARLEAWEARYWAAHAEQVRALAAHAAAKGTATALGSSLSVRLDAFSCDSSEIALPCAARFTLTRVPGHTARHASPVTVDVIAPGVPAGDCTPTSSSVRAPWGVPTADEPAAVLSARCREPEAAATAWLVLVRTGGDEAALSTGL